MPFDALIVVDYVIIVAVSALAAFMMRRWGDLTLAIIAALAADLAVMALINMIGGAGPEAAMTASVARYTAQTGDVLILRGVLYGAAIGLIFAWKRLYLRR